MAHILLLDARAFAVNFYESWAVLQSEFPSLSQIIQSITVQETLTPSSINPVEGGTSGQHGRNTKCVAKTATRCHWNWPTYVCYNDIADHSMP